MTDAPDPLPALAALAEPTRLRIVELLHAAPRSVGEIAGRLDLRQPQATKHLQALQRAGLVTLHPLGTRRIYALRRGPVEDLRAWLAPLAVEREGEDVLARYQRAIEAEAGAAGEAPAPRTLTFARELAAPPAAVWEAWTSADVVRRWWAPPHFAVPECEVDPTPGGVLRIVMEEGDGTRHVAEGRFTTVRPRRALTFAMAPAGPDGRSLFSAVHEVRLGRREARTKVDMTIRVTDARPEAVPALAGMEPGWENALDQLATVL